MVSDLCEVQSERLFKRNSAALATELEPPGHDSLPAGLGRA